MIPIANCTLTVTRVTQPEDGYEEAVETVVATGVRAVISEAGGSFSRNASGGLVSSDRKMTSDLADIRPGDKVTCSVTGATYEVSWVARHPGPITHLTASLSEARYRP